MSWPCGSAPSPAVEGVQRACRCCSRYRRRRWCRRRSAAVMAALRGHAVEHAADGDEATVRLIAGVVRGARGEVEQQRRRVAAAVVVDAEDGAVVMLAAGERRAVEDGADQRHRVVPRIVAVGLRAGEEVIDHVAGAVGHDLENRAVAVALRRGRRGAPEEQSGGGDVGQRAPGVGAVVHFALAGGGADAEGIQHGLGAGRHRVGDVIAGRGLQEPSSAIARR